MYKIVGITAALLAFVLFSARAHACPLIDGLVDYNCDGKHVISVTGDSVVFGVGDLANGNQGGYVLRMSRAFKSSEVLNFGYPGITTNHLLSYYKRLFAKSPNSEQAVKLGNSDIVIIDVGRNDYYNRNSSATTAQSIKRLTTYLSSEIQKRFGTSPLFVVAVLPPTRRELDLNFIRQVNMVMLKIRGQNFPAYLRFDTLSAALLAKDGLHPSSRGYDVLGNIVIKYIKGEAQTRSKKVRKDLDRDGIYDVFEKTDFNTSPDLADSDADGLKDGDEEFVYGTDPVNPDTDGDGVNDGIEVEQGRDPKTAN